MMHLKNLIQTAAIPGSDGWQTAVVTVDTVVADSLLEGNRHNRRLNPGAVARYAATMRKGDWKTSPEPLIFAPNGRLLNGQTRLHAVKATGIAQNFLCVFGVAETVFAVLDRGRPRSFADAHNMHPDLAQTARLLARIYYPERDQVTDSDMLRIARLIETVHSDVTASCNARRRLFSSASFRAAAALRMLNGESPDYVLGLYRNLVLGELDQLPPAGHAAVRATLAGSWVSGAGATIQKENLARAWGLFVESGADRGRLPLKDPAGALVDIRSAISRALRDSAAV